jgi:hypothetical protein
VELRVSLAGPYSSYLEVAFSSHIAWEASGGTLLVDLPICGCTLRCREGITALEAAISPEPTTEQSLHKSSLLPMRGDRFEAFLHC